MSKTLDLKIDVEWLEQAADRGAKWYDGYKPEWFDLIDPEVLAMRDGNACMIGQLEGSYNSSINMIRDRFHLNRNWEVEHGFYVPDGLIFYFSGQIDFKYVNDYWFDIEDAVSHYNEFRWDRKVSDDCRMVSNVAVGAAYDILDKAWDSQITTRRIKRELDETESQKFHRPSVDNYNREQIPTSAFRG